jgi:hypothetical protein
MKISKKHRCWSSAIILTCLAGCGPFAPNSSNATSAPPPNDFVAHGDVRGEKALIFVGDITARKVSGAVKALSKDTKWLVMSSNGGNSEAAMQLGREIRDRNLKLFIEGPCASACASYIFPAASFAELGHEGFVTSFKTDSQKALLPNAFEVLGKPSNLSELLGRQKAYLTSLGIEGSAFDHWLGESFYRCYLPRKKDDGFTEILSEVTMVVPSAGMLKSKGITVPVNWPTNESELKARTTKRGINPAFVSYIYAEYPPVRRFEACQK